MWETGMVRAMTAITNWSHSLFLGTRVNINGFDVICQCNFDIPMFFPASTDVNIGDVIKTSDASWMVTQVTRYLNHMQVKVRPEWYER